MKNEVSNTEKQYLKLHGRRVLVCVPEFFRENGLKFIITGNVTSVLVPLAESTKNSFSAIETFVKANVNSDKYKPLWLHEVMYINISQWCEYAQINPDGTRTLLPSGAVLGRGFYSMTVHASHIYIGPHKNGEKSSLPFHVTQINYRPADDFTDLISLLGGDLSGGPKGGAPSAVVNDKQSDEKVDKLEIQGKKKRTRRNVNAKDEVSKCLPSVAAAQGL